MKSLWIASFKFDSIFCFYFWRSHKIDIFIACDDLKKIKKKIKMMQNSVRRGKGKQHRWIWNISNSLFTILKLKTK